jgi:hypothetical protein
MEPSKNATASRPARPRLCHERFKLALSWSANYFRYFDQVLTAVIGSRKIPGRKIRPVNLYSIFLPHIFLLLSVGFELPNQYQLIFADELTSSCPCERRESQNLHGGAIVGGESRENPE